MSDNCECPFCGLRFDPASAHPFDPMCPVSTFIFRADQWRLRAPKKECSDIPKIQSEVEWLRCLVERLTLEPEPVTPLHIEYKPDEVTK